MLHTATVHTDTLSLLKEIMSIEGLSGFSLAGGTALALHIGHRISYDLDFFGSPENDLDNLTSLLNPGFVFQEMHRTQNILILDINGVKVDFVRYNYPLIGNSKTEEGIRLLSVEDIAAMKLDAVKGRGRKRDFYDLFFLLERFELESLLDFHIRKYQQDTRFLILKSLTYFEDAENDGPVNLIDKGPNWNEVKQVITQHVSQF